MNRYTPLAIPLILALLCTPLAYADSHEEGEYCEMHHKKSFKEADADQDGALNEEEAKTACSRKFSKMDKDGDGKVTEKELNSCGRSKHKRKHGHDHHGHDH